MAGKLDTRKVYYAVLELIVQHRPSSITYSMIARKVGVSRPALYYYFGNDLDQVISESVRHGMKLFTRLFEIEKGKKYRSWDEFQTRRFSKAYRLVERYPWIPVLYFRYRTTQEAWGQEIRAVEKLYSEAMRREWKKQHGKEPSAEALRISNYMKLGILWGMAAEKDAWKKSGPQKRKHSLERSAALISAALKD